MICQHCGQQHPSHYSYCPKTSKLINAEQPLTYNTSEYCANCSTKNEKGFSYCVNCGHTYLTKTPKKKGIGKIVENSFSNFKIPSKVNVNTEDIKEVSAKNLEYIRNNKLILVPIAISMVLVILLSLILKISIMSTIEEAAEEANMDFIFNLNELEDELNDRGLKIDLPKVHVTPLLMTLAHNINYGAEISSDFLRFEGELSLNNLFTALLIIPIISLIIGGIIYGRMAVKNNWSLYKGLIFSTITYLVFMIIVSFFARTSYEKKLMVLKLSPSFFDLVVSAIVLTILFFGGAAIISYYGKAVVEEAEKTSKYLLYGLSALVVTLTGFVINYLYSFIFLMNKIGETNEMSLLGKFVVSIYTSMITWFMSLFGIFHYSQDGDEYSYMLLFNSDVSEFLEEFDVEGSLGFVIILALIVIAIIGAVSYFLYEKHQLNLKDVVIFAVSFAVFQLLALYMTNISIDGFVDRDSTEISIGFNAIVMAITSFIISGASFYGGGFLRQKLSK